MLNNLKTTYKILILIIAYALLSLISYKLILYKTTGLIDSIGLSFVLSWVMVLYGFVFFQLFKYFRLSDYVYRKKKVESKLWFRLLGIDLFQFLLVHSFFRYLNPRVYVKGRKNYIKVYHEETKQAETSHILSTIATLIASYLLFEKGEYYSIIFLNYFSLLFNIYPILLQRKNRFILESRFGNLLKKKDI